MTKKDFILLIPYYNNFNGLINSIKSVNYPNSKFEMLIIDDGSNPPLNLQKLKEFDENINIHLIRLPENQGVLKALNTGLLYLHNRNDFKYIARLDCGDTCHADRFIKQVTFLNNNQEIGLLGTWCRFTDIISGKSYIYRTKTNHDEILKEMHFKCSFIHPTMMFRKEIIDTVGYYPEGYPDAEDYAYFWIILNKYNGAILNEILVNIGVLRTNISSRNFKKQLISRKKIIRDMGYKAGLKIPGIFLLRLRQLFPFAFFQKIKFYYLKK